MRNKILELDDLTIEDFELYCEHMYEGFEIIQSNITSFLKYRDLDDDIKIYLLQEMHEFFYLEDDYLKCEFLNSLLSNLYRQKWVRSWIYKK